MPIASITLEMVREWRASRRQRRAYRLLRAVQTIAQVFDLADRMTSRRYRAAGRPQP